MEERCHICPNQCLKSELKCGRGKQSFNQSTDQSTYHNDHHYSHHHGKREEDDLTSKMIKCSQLLTHKTGKKHGQERILKILDHHTSLSQKELQEKLHIEAGSLSEILSKLERNGMIEKKRDEQDRRKMIITLTSKGQHVIEHRKNNDQDLFDMLDETESKQLNDLLDKILQSWYQRHLRYHSRERNV